MSPTGMAAAACIGWVPGKLSQGSSSVSQPPTVAISPRRPLTKHLHAVGSISVPARCDWSACGRRRDLACRSRGGRLNRIRLVKPRFLEPSMQSVTAGEISLLFHLLIGRAEGPHPRTPGRPTLSSPSPRGLAHSKGKATSILRLETSLVYANQPLSVKAMAKTS